MKTYTKISPKASHGKLKTEIKRLTFPFVNKFSFLLRYGLESNVLRFVAKMDTERPIEVDRRFTISYFLSDDTILVFEPPQRNSGIIGGKFLERGRVKKPDGESYYTAQVSLTTNFLKCHGL